MKFRPNLFLYVVFGLVFFGFWMIVVFPYDALKSRVVTEIENRSNGRYKIEAKDMSLSLFGSMTFKNFQLLERKATGDELWIESPKAKVSFSPLQLLRKTVNGSFYVKGKKQGEISGDFHQENDFFEIALDFDEYSLGDLAFLSQGAKLPLSGKVDGDFSLKLHRLDSKANRGKADLSFSDLALEATSVAMDPTDPSTKIDLPKVKLSGPKGSGLKGEVQNDRYEFSSLKLQGGDLDLDMQGRMTLRGRSWRDYRLSLQGNMKFTEALTQAVPYLGVLEPQKTPQGQYPLSISGRVAKPVVDVGRFRLPL